MKTPEERKSYRVRTMRLSDEVWNELKRRQEASKSWNIMFKDLLGIKTPFKLRQKKAYDRQ